MPQSLAHSDLTSLSSQLLSTSGSTTLLRAMFNSPPAPIPGAPTLPWVLPVLLQSVSFLCNIRGQYPGIRSGVVPGKCKEDVASPPQGFL